MEKRKLFKVYIWPIWLMCALVSSCDQELYERTTQTFTEVIKKDVPNDTVPENDPSKDYYLKPYHVAEENVMEIADSVGENTTNSHFISRGSAIFTLERDRYTTEEKFKNLSVAYSNAHKTMEETEEIDENGDIRHITHCTFDMEDGDIGFIEAETWQLVREIDGESHTFPFAKLSSFEVESFENLPYTSPTRGTYEVDSCDTKPVVRLHYVYAGTNEPAFDVRLTQLCHRKFVADDDVKSWSYDNVVREVLTKKTERGAFRLIAHRTSGAVEYLEKSAIFYYEVAGIGERTLPTNDFGYHLFSSTGVIYGDLKMDRADGSWVFSRRPFTYASTFTTPQGDVLETKYTGYTEEAVYDDGNVHVVFPVLDIKVNEGTTTIEPQTSSDLYEQALLTNSVDADYQGCTQSASETVVLLKQAATVVDEFWDEDSEEKVISLWNIKTKIDYVVKRSDNTEERTTYVFNWPWNFIPKSFWAVRADTPTFTVSPMIDHLSSQPQSFTSKDGLAVWSANEDEHTLTSTVSVANGTQTDEFYANTYNDISIKRNENVHFFGHDEYIVRADDGKLGDMVTTSDGDVLPYKRTVDFGIGDFTTKDAVEGKITIPKADIPTFFGVLESIDCIVVNNPDHDDYWYSLLAHEKGGRVIPGIWKKKGEVEWFLDDAQQTSATNLNGCVYVHKTGKWVPVHAWDSPDLLQYNTEDGYNADNQSYVTALSWNWDEGRTINGHPSVNTFRIFVTMIDGTVSLTDTYYGVSLGSWTYK